MQNSVELTYIQGMARAMAAVKVRLDWQLDGTITPLLFKVEDGPTQRIDRILKVNGSFQNELGTEGVCYRVRCGKYLYNLYYEPRRQPHWFVLLDEVRHTPLFWNETDAP